MKNNNSVLPLSPTKKPHPCTRSKSSSNMGRWTHALPALLVLAFSQPSADAFVPDGWTPCRSFSRSRVLGSDMKEQSMTEDDNWYDEAVSDVSSTTPRCYGGTGGYADPSNDDEPGRYVLREDESFREEGAVPHSWRVRVHETPPAAPHAPPTPHVKDSSSFSSSNRQEAFREGERRVPHSSFFARRANLNRPQDPRQEFASSRTRNWNSEVQPTVPHSSFFAAPRRGGMFKKPQDPPSDGIENWNREVQDDALPETAEPKSFDADEIVDIVNQGLDYMMKNATFMAQVKNKEAHHKEEKAASKIEKLTTNWKKGPKKLKKLFSKTNHLEAFRDGEVSGVGVPSFAVPVSSHAEFLTSNVEPGGGMFKRSGNVEDFRDGKVHAVSLNVINKQEVQAVPLSSYLVPKDRTSMKPQDPIKASHQVPKVTNWDGEIQADRVPTKPTKPETRSSSAAPRGRMLNRPKDRKQGPKVKNWDGEVLPVPTATTKPRSSNVAPRGRVFNKPQDPDKTSHQVPKVTNWDRDVQADPVQTKPAKPERLSSSVGGMFKESKYPKKASHVPQVKNWDGDVLVPTKTSESASNGIVDIVNDALDYFMTDAEIDPDKSSPVAGEKIGEAHAATEKEKSDSKFAKYKSNWKKGPKKIKKLLKKTHASDRDDKFETALNVDDIVDIVNHALDYFILNLENDPDESNAKPGGGLFKKRKDPKESSPVPEVKNVEVHSDAAPLETKPSDIEEPKSDDKENVANQDVGFFKSHARRMWQRVAANKIAQLKGDTEKQTRRMQLETLKEIEERIDKEVRI